MAVSFASIFLFLCIALGLVYIYLVSNLPDVESLKNVTLQEPLRIYSSEGKLIAEMGTKRRIPTTIDKIPPTLIKAILATEDQRFFDHPGIDMAGLLRAGINLLKTGDKSQGASTITMQVARNFFLSRQKTFARKINEILLAIKIDQDLPKKKILELYLNKIYFGQGAYGVVAAANVYYGKSLNKLSIAQLAMIAGLPQAPSKINPVTSPELALKRRNHVLKRMLDEKVLTKQEYTAAVSSSMTAKYHGRKIELEAPYVAELIRKSMLESLGEIAYNSGYKIYLSIKQTEQVAANEALARALHEYDMRYGYRGPIDNVAIDEIEKLDWQQYPQIPHHLVAVVTNIHADHIVVTDASKQQYTVSFKDMEWARKAKDSKGIIGEKPTGPEDVVAFGDVIHIKQKQKRWVLSQLPKAQGGFVAINPKTGRIIAMVGGYNYQLNKFNHVTQAKRQSGSIFKPFIYAAALENGYTLASKINDAPIVKQDQSQDNFLWRPQNHNRTFTGMISLRKGLMLSRNLVSIRILESIGISRAKDTLADFGFEKADIPNSLSIALGSADVSIIDLAYAYCVFANHGNAVNQHLLESIVSPKGTVVYETKDMPTIRNRAISPQTAYLITNVLQDTIQYGITGRVTKTQLTRSDIAGKTGSTNDNKDAWFAGFTPSRVAISWVGFDQPQSLHEYGSSAALPMWLYYMKAVLQNQPVEVFKEPSGLTRVRIDDNEQGDGYFELFRSNNAPKTENTKTTAPAPVSQTDYLF